MYESDDVALLLPGVCWNHHLYPARSETGRKGHVCTRNDGFWASPPRPEPKSSIDPAQYRLIDWPTPNEIDAMSTKDQRYWQARTEKAIEPAKRKSFINPKTVNSVWAELIDVQRGWDKADLTLKERQALLLTYGLNWTQQEIADNQGVSQPAISQRISNALHKIAACINGGVWYELEGIEA